MRVFELLIVGATPAVVFALVAGVIPGEGEPFVVVKLLEVNRPLVLLSGVMFHIEDLPKPLFAVLKWNPAAQIVAQMRHAFYPNYDIPWVSPAYVICIAAVSFALGLVGLYRFIFDVLDI